MGDEFDTVTSRPTLDRSRALGDRAGRTEDGRAEHLRQHLRVEVERVDVLSPEDLDEWGRSNHRENAVGGSRFATGSCRPAHADAERAEVSGEGRGGAPFGVEDEPRTVRKLSQP